MRLSRLILLAVVAIGLSPGLWWRETPPAPAYHAPFLFKPLGPPPAATGLEEVSVWRVDSRNPHAGGFSALVHMGGGRFLAGSDRGRALAFDGPTGRIARQEIGFFGKREGLAKFAVDLESLTFDRDAGLIWAGYENSNRIERFDPQTGRLRARRPAAMAQWSTNSGAESMVRLADGRFVVIAEGDPDWGAADFPAVVFLGDPVEQGTTSKTFRFSGPEGYRPVDAAQMPDGDVLILMRRFSVFASPRFQNRIVRVDPGQISEGAVWSGKEVARIDSPQLAENYEGMAITSDAHGHPVVWLISDDNRSVLQETRLLRAKLKPERPLAAPASNPVDQPAP